MKCNKIEKQNLSKVKMEFRKIWNGKLVPLHFEFIHIRHYQIYIHFSEEKNSRCLSEHVVEIIASLTRCGFSLGCQDSFESLSLRLQI